MANVMKSVAVKLCGEVESMPARTHARWHRAVGLVLVLLCSAAWLSVALWAWSVWAPEKTLVRNSAGVVTLSDDAALVATVTLNGDVVVIDLGSLNEVGRLTDQGRAPISLRFSPDGRVVAMGFEKDPVRVWRLRGDGLIGVVGPDSVGALYTAISEDNRYLATCSGRGAITLWNLASGEKVVSTSAQPTYGWYTHDLSQLAFVLNDRALLAVAHGPECISLEYWDPRTGGRIQNDGRFTDLQASDFRYAGRSEAILTGESFQRVWLPSVGDILQEQDMTVDVALVGSRRQGAKAGSPSEGEHGHDIQPSYLAIGRHMEHVVLALEDGVVVLLRPRSLWDRLGTWRLCLAGMLTLSSAIWLVQRGRWR